MKATGLKRGSRKKQEASNSSTAKEEQQPPQRHLGVPVSKQQQQLQQHQRLQQQVQPQQQPPQPDPFQQKRKQNDELTALTTKNYRLAKELADLRVRYRDECKNVTRLTMENMNLASRCRETISHVAMLKKELSMQQKRTADALASQRQQTQRMADSLTSSMELSRISRSNSEELEDVKDVTVSRLSTTTPSPLRTGSAASDDSAGTSKTSSTTDRSPSPPEEARDSPPSDSASSPMANGSDLDEDDTVEDTIGIASSSSFSPTEAVVKNTKKDVDEHLPSSYSTPKRSERWTPTFHETNNDDDESGPAVGRLFPSSASPNPFHEDKSYDLKFPSDIIQPGSKGKENSKDDSDNSGEANHESAETTMSSHQRKLDLLNSIDAFEKSFAMDFPDSFTPKESSSSLDEKNHKTDIYNPFFATPERRFEKSRSPFSDVDVDTNGSPVGLPRTGSDKCVFNSPTEEKKMNEPLHPYDSSHRASNFRTPPRGGRLKATFFSGEPARPEKVIPSAARARYEQALQPRQNATSNDSSSAMENTVKSNNSPSVLLRRIKQKRMNKSEESSSERTEPEISGLTDSRGDLTESVQQTFEEVAVKHTTGEMTSKGGRPSMSTRISAVKGLRRSVKQPVSYAEPPLNTKLRQGDVYFPKVEGESQIPIVTPVASPADQVAN